MNYSYSYPSKIRVRYGETDQMGYCYYGNYAQYFEVGRVEALRSIGLSYKTLEMEGIMLPVSSFTVKYFSPAKYDDELIVNTIISEIKGARINFTYEILNSENKLICTAETMLVFVDKNNMKPIQAPALLIQLLEKYAVKN
jgi:acyl-CoA thioester hydrolase